MSSLLDKGDMQWQKVADSEFGGLWCMEGSLETWSWSLNVPVLSSLSDDDEVIEQLISKMHTLVFINMLQFFRSCDL